MKKTGAWLAAICLLAATAQAADPPQAVPSPASDNQASAPPPSADNTAPPIREEPVIPQAAPPQPPVQPPPERILRPAEPPPAPVQAPPPQPPIQAPLPQQAETKRMPVYISMDFTDVDLPVLIKFISEQTRKNFIFDERVQGKITIISPRKISVEDAYNVFLSVLQVKGFATIEQGNAIKIIALRDAKQDSLPTARAGEPASASEFITRLIPLQYTDTAEIVPVLSPIVSKDGLLTAFPASNMLILIDSRSNIDRVMKILAELDVEGTSGILRIFPFKYASVTEIARTLDSLYTGAGTAPAAPGQAGAGARAVRRGKGRGGAIRFIPDVRTNSLIVLAGADLMSDIEDLIKKLDIPSPENTGKINVYYLEHSDAEEVAKVLANLSGRAPTTPTAPAAAGPAGTVKSVITAELEGGVRIAADKATNSLIIIASVNDYLTLVDVIKKLDIRRRQVYVEAVIMEITLDKGRDVGVEFRGSVASAANKGALLSGTNFDFQGNVNELFSALASGNPLVFSGTGLIAGGILGNVTLPDGTQIPAVTAILRAAQTSDNINVLSSPHLLTLDNKEAEIIVGQNVPFITSQSRDSTNLANTINTIERKDVGITLRLTPHIHESEYVNLEIYQESSAILGTQLLNANQVGPTTTKRSAKTSVLVKNGNTVVMGGMMQDSLTVSESQVPLLGDIPLLGNLFKFKSVARNKTNLLIFLTPHVIKEPTDMAKIGERKQAQMDEFIKRKDGLTEQKMPRPGALANP
ncbi:MAG: type II secretion system secretin GspD [Deltaproteobacteria bacterium]|nr:type II secretion system secretin GspD [Deltaproteobacteria bacterium]